MRVRTDNVFRQRLTVYPFIALLSFAQESENAHQHSDGPHQHPQTSAQRAAEHQPGAERKQRARNEANGGEHVHSGEGDGAQSRVVFNPLQEALENVGDETQSGNLPVGNKENKDTAVNWSVYVDEDR